jgi:hypothetical protein
LNQCEADSTYVLLDLKASFLQAFAKDEPRQGLLSFFKKSILAFIQKWKESDTGEMTTSKNPKENSLLK